MSAIPIGRTGLDGFERLWVEVQTVLMRPTSVLLFARLFWTNLVLVIFEKFLEEPDLKNWPNWNFLCDLDSTSDESDCQEV
jgi:hypothetical protein